ncbi:MAG TPA: hypothetical protein VMW76_09700 [Bacteroidales bacterium]|nr:hypothetical protein [Bacteroidales bacterium]
MLRFKLHQKVEPVALPAGKYGCMSHPGFEPYEQIRSVGKSWQIVEVCDNDNISFYAEHLHTGFKTAAISGKGIESYHKAVEQWKYYESLPAGQMPNIQSQESSQKPDFSFFSLADNEALRIKAANEKAEKALEAMKIETAKKQSARDREILGYKIDDMKEALAQAEYQFKRMAPKPEPDPDKSKVDGDND